MIQTNEIALHAEAQVEEIFNRLFEDLPERLQRLLLGVVVYRDAFGLEMARGMLVDVELEDLCLLVNAGFLLARGDRWLLHPLTGRLVWQVLVADNKEQQSHQRAINYFLLHLKSEVTSIEDCTEHFEIFHHWCELSKYALAKEIMDNCVVFLTRRGYYLALLSIYDRLTKNWSIAKPTDTGEKRSLGEVRQILGSLYYHLGQYPAAISYFEQLDFTINEALSLSGLGAAYYAIGSYQRAIDCLQRSLIIYRNLSDHHGEAASLNTLGIAYREIGEYQMAINFLQQSLTITCEIGDLGGESASLTNLGAAYRAVGEYQMAINFLQRSLTITCETGNRNDKANALGNLGIIHLKMREYETAIVFYISL